MEKIFVHITELQNQTNQQLEFEVVNDNFQLRPLRPGKIRQIRQWKILHFCRKHDSNKWKIRVLINRQFSGIEISPLHLLCYARIVFKFQTIGTNLCLLSIDGILEKPVDLWLRLKYLGCMRNEFWKRRPYIQIARADPKWAIKLSNVNRDQIEEPPQQLVVVPLAIHEKSLRQKQSQKEVKKTYLINGPEKVNGSLAPVDDSVEISKKRVGIIPAVQPKSKKVMADHGMRKNVMELEADIFRGLINNGVYRERTVETWEQEQMIQNMETIVRLLLLAISFMFVCFVHLLFSI